MEQDVTNAIDRVVHADWSTDDTDAILQQLEAELQRQTQPRTFVLRSEPAPVWVAATEQAARVQNLAQRFVSFYADAIQREICDPQGGLKDLYRQILISPELRDQLRLLVPVVLAAIGVGAGLINPAIVAALVALWLLRIGLEQWCAARAAA